jgi:hypothetical protein
MSNLKSRTQGGDYAAGWCWLASAGVAFASIVMLAACAIDGVRTVKGDNYAYSRSYLYYAAGSGPVPAIIRGNALPGLSQEAFSGRVLAEIKDRPLGVGPVTFAEVDPAKLGRTPLFVSFVFNPGSGFGGYDACTPAYAASAGGPARADGSARVVAAFCSSQRLLTETVGEVSGLTGPDDPRFGTLMRLVILDLFPPYDPNPGISRCDSCP